MKRLLREDRVLVDCERCPRLAEALESVQGKVTRAEGGERTQAETYRKDGRHEHYLDAAGYLVANAFPSTDGIRPEGVFGGAPALFGGISGIRLRYSESDFG
jgi:hypothetical protein